MISAEKYYVLYDGECGFCNFWVHWILKRDKKDNFLFASLQSDFGQKFLADRNLARDNFNTLYLWKPDQYYLQKSHAVFKITEIIGGLYHLISYLRFLPSGLTDVLYNMVAENRQKLATQHCELPTPEERKKFID